MVADFVLCPWRRRWCEHTTWISLLQCYRIFKITFCGVEITCIRWILKLVLKPLFCCFKKYLTISPRPPSLLFSSPSSFLSVPLPSPPTLLSKTELYLLSKLLLSHLLKGNFFCKSSNPAVWRELQHTQLQLLLLLAVFQLGKEKWHFQCRFIAHSLSRASISAYVFPGWKRILRPWNKFRGFLPQVIEVNEIFLHENHLFGSKHLVTWQPRLFEEVLMSDYAGK